MDDFVKTTLERWNLASYIPSFEENEIDEESFRCLTHDIVKGLIPKLGPQAKFLKYWTSEFSINPVTSLGIGPEMNNANLTSDFGRMHDALLSSLDTGFDLPSTSFPSDLDTSERDSATAGPPSVQHTLSCTGSNFSKTSSTSNTIYSGQSAISASVSTSSKSHAPYNTNSSFIKTTLNQTPEGVAVLRHYERAGNLDNQRRILLAGVVIAAELKDSKGFTLSRDRLVELARLIVQQFPTESIDTYYIPYKLNKITNQKILAKGKLYDKYCAYRDLLRKNGAIPAVKRKNGGQLVQPLRPAVILAGREQLDQSETEPIGDCLENVQWLKNNLEPWSSVEQYWRDTSKHRIKQLSSTTELSSVEYLNTYSALKQPLGYNLICIDFAVLYPDKTLDLYGKWSPFQAEVIQFCRERKQSDSAVQKLLSHVQDGVNPDTLVPVILRLLPLLLPCTSVKAPNKPGWRPSKLEVQNGFFLHVSSVGQLDTSLERRKQKLLNHGLTEQPIPIIVGENLTAVNACYIYFNGIKYEVESPLKALDVTFKSFYVLQLEYPKEAALAWMVIQKRLFDLTGEGDRVLPSVNTLLFDLANCSASAERSD